VFALAALSGGAMTSARWAQLGRTGRVCGLSGVVACAGLFVFGLTSLGNDMSVWVAG
jgi:hypothetical protein